MTREEKSKVIEDLTGKLTDNNIIYLADISGLNALQTSNLRRACFKANVNLAVVKNTLLAKAMEKAENSAEQKLVLSGLSNISDPGALEVIEPFLQDETVQKEAGMAAIKIAKSIMKTNGEKVKTAMNKLLSVSRDEILRKQAEAIIPQIETLQLKN